MIPFDGEKLKQTIIDTLIAEGVNNSSAFHAANSMVQTSLRGVDSHGINLFPHYFRSYRSGRLNKNPMFKFEQRKDAIAVLDADHAIGHHAGIVAMDKCIEMASEYGIGACAVKNSSHYGASSYFGLYAAEKDYIGMSFTNADALVKAHNGKHAFFGTNPICFCAPMNNESPFCLDMATSLVSWNKIKNYRRSGDAIPEHWAYDKNGNSVTDANIAASLSPAGEYKGYGLWMMVEILTALLAGSVIGKDMLAMFTSPPEAQRKVSHFFLVMDIDAFLPKDAFIASLTEMAVRLRNEVAAESEAVMVPGDPEKEMFKIRTQEGIPCFEEIVDEYKDINPAFQSCISKS